MGEILLVDDEEDITFTAKKILERDGHRIVVAKDSEECMKILENDRPNLILLDVMMPGMDGWEACKKIKEDKKTKDIPVIMFTVLGSNDSIEKSWEYAHADAHINKPFRKAELLNVVRELLKEKR